MILGVLPVLAALLLLYGCGKPTVETSLNNAAREAGSGNWQLVVKHCDRALDREPGNASALVFKALACEKLGDNDRALDAASQATKSNPDSFLAFYTLGRLYAKDSTRYSDALAALTRAQKLAPTDKNTLILLTNVYAAVNPAKQLTYLLFLMKFSPDMVDTAEFYNQLGIAQALNKSPLAKETLLKAYRKNTNDPVVIFNVATYFDQYEPQTRGAIQYYREFLRAVEGNKDYDVKRILAENRLKQITK